MQERGRIYSMHNSQLNAECRVQDAELRGAKLRLYPVWYVLFSSRMPPTKCYRRGRRPNVPQGNLPLAEIIALIVHCEL